MRNPFLPNEAPTPQMLAQADAIRAASFELLKTFPVGTREGAIATTKLEEASMWAVKGVMQK